MDVAARRTSPRGRAALAVLVAGYVLVEALAGSPDSPLVPPLPPGSGVPGWTRRAAGVLGLDRLGRLGLTWVSLAVLAVVVGAFLVAAREAWRGRLTLRAAAVAGGAALALVMAGPLLLSRDVYSYAAYGRLLALHGSNPYTTAPSAFPGDAFTPVVSRAWVGTTSVYGPAFTLLSGAVAGSWKGSPGATVLAFRWLAGLMAAVTAAIAVAVCRRARPERATFALVAVALNPVVILHTVGGGHNDVLVGTLVAAAAAVALPRGWAQGRLPPGEVRAFAVTALLTVAALVKIVGLIPLALWWWTLLRNSGDGAERSNRPLAAHVALALLLAAGLTAPLFAGWRSVTAILNLASRQGGASGARLVATGAAGLGRAVAGKGAGEALRGGLFVLFLGAFTLLVWRANMDLAFGRRRAPDIPGGSPQSPPERWGRALILFALAAPYLLPWYAAWFLPLIALVGDGVIVAVGLAMCAVLAMTGVPTEPATQPSLWRDMLLGVHYVAAPAILALFAVAARRSWWSSPLPASPQGGPRTRAGGRPLRTELGLESDVGAVRPDTVERGPE